MKVLAVIGVFLTILAVILWISPENNVTRGQELSQTSIRIKIPAIGVDANVEHTDRLPDGSIGVPSDHRNAALFDGGPYPGEKGSAVIDGHYGWKNNIPAVFDDLDKLSKGDKIYVEDRNGTTTFIVREVTAFSEKADASKVFTSTDGKAHLNLITCGGVWNKAEKSYSKRLVVFADKLVR